ncbi:MAG TPA: FtsX-like permease family protein [Ktedonobacterales bacterium]|nr:FtsX-like permease family protein [Ktedonobacterales bacterium]
MKFGLYWKYPVRSLWRGGQRTMLAIFCVAVGVLAIVALQLVGNMINNSLTTNVREGNGGDVSIRNDFAPVESSQLTYFDQLRTAGTITAYTAVSEHDAQTSVGGHTQFYIVKAVDPHQFPLVGAPDFVQPAGGSLASLLSGNAVVVTKNLLASLDARVGDQVQVTSDDGRLLNVTVAGTIQDAGFYRRPQMLMALDAYAAVSSTAGKPVNFQAVYATVPGGTDANAAAVAKQVQREFPLATVTTTKQALQQQENSVQKIRNFLQIVGLLSLLIGGVGIVNTMQVLLRRRRVEIAMLKTAGYRQRQLYILFGIEAGLLGLLGGLIGSAAGIGVSYFIKQLVERAFFIHLTFALDPFTVGSGVVIGLVTALIFGILPIVQASQIRPQAVLREGSERGSVGSVVLSGFLLLLLGGLFYILAASILGDLRLAGYVVGGALAVLLTLTLLFTIVVLIISRLPVLERLTWWYAVLMVIALAAAGAATYYLPGFGVLFLVVALFGVIVVFLPRTWKSNVKMALRNLARARARTVTTMIALFVGVFAIGLVLVLGQNIKQSIDQAFNTTVKYNSFIIAGAVDKSAVDAQVPGLPGLESVASGANCPAQRYEVNPIAQAIPLAVNGTPVTQLLQGAGSPGINNLGRGGALRVLSSVEGYDLSAQALPSCDVNRITTDEQGNPLGGRSLTAADAGTYNVVVARSATMAPLNLKVGDAITVLAADRKTPITLNVVGFFDDAGAVVFGSILVDTPAVNTLTAGMPVYIYALKEDPTKADQALQQLQQAVPTVQTYSLVDLTLFIDTLLSNLIVMLVSVASLAMLAGIIIIANAVALAMLERRRELGILKSVGHTSGSVLREVLMENGTVGFTGALIAMLLVTLATTVLGVVLFQTDFGINAPIVLGITLITALVCMVVAAFVAWGATRVRPLDVLRYE